MIEVRLFATLRNGREKMLFLEPEQYQDISTITTALDIPDSEVAIMLINGRHSKLHDSVKDGDVIALFPPIGGG